MVDVEGPIMEEAPEWLEKSEQKQVVREDVLVALEEETESEES